MGNPVIRTGDTLVVEIPGAIIPALLKPVPLTGSSRTTSVEKGTACLEGDELPAELRGPLPYSTTAYIGGSGTLTLTLGSDDRTGTTTCDGKTLLTAGAEFKATFDVSKNPAKQSNSSDPDLLKSGTAHFVTANRSTSAR
ncbi:hypothetical protein ACFVVA_17430 [Kitasatospora sp. NPDC058048]|uniref:hypothetical protein n=1 Tax=Kitasatospora sp. NPDC058048 TaxID=3346313 RepID=UPI0036DF6AE0